MKKAAFLQCLIGSALAGILCCVASANESTTYAPDPVDRTGDETRVTGPDPSRIGSMAGIGSKPSKAELAKMNQAGAQRATGNAAPAAGIRAEDRQFVTIAAKQSLGQAEMGRMAAQQAQSAEVKKLGDRIAADHTRAYQQLLAIAARKGINLATSRDAPKMSKKDAVKFDQAWLAMMINDHQKLVASFQRQAQQGSDPELRDFARRTLPSLQQHLAAAKAAQRKVGSTAVASGGTRR